MTGTKFIMFLVAASAASYFLWGREDPNVGVNLQGVNHTADTFSFYLKDPDDPELISGGSGAIDPFGASGITCCAVLPRVWKPDLKLQIHATHWVVKPPDKKLVEIKEVIVADVPKYVDEKPGELWVLRTADGKVEVVLSDYQPDHPNWPGNVKGWPVPSIEYRREKWELYRKLASERIISFTEALEELETAPLATARENWEFTKQYRQNDLKGFSGPEDPLYLAELKTSYENVLELSKQDLRQLMESKP